MKKYFMLLIAFMLFGCGGGETVEENVIRINVGSEPETIDPTLNSSIDGSVYIAHSFEGLAMKDQNDKIAFGVADKWDISDDGLTYTFHIRDNAKWTDGKAVTADDFIYAWRRAVDPKTASEYSFQLAPIKNAVAITEGNMPIESLGVRAIDDKTLEVTLVSPTAYFLELVAFTTYFPIRQDIIEEYGDQWTLTPETYIGNGAFKMTERSFDDKIVMEKNEHYWNISSIVPNKLIFILMQNENSAVAGIKEGSLDFAIEPPPQDIPLLINEGIVQIHPKIGTFYYSINYTNEITKDPRVRRALALVIDRQYIVDEVTKGGQIPAGAWVPNGINDLKGDFRENGGDYYSVDTNDYKANVAEAKQLMLEAGYPDGEGFPVLEFKTSTGAETRYIFEAIQQMWKEELGVDSTLVQEEDAVFNITKSSRNFVIASGVWVGDYNDPMTFMDVFMSHSPQNTVYYNNPKYDELINTARLSGNQDVRMKAMHDAEAILLGEMGLIPLYFFTQPLLVNPKLKDVFFNPLSAHKFHYSYIEE